MPAPFPSPQVDRSHAGSRLPDLTFHDAAGKPIRLGSLAGKPLLINFWATWCAPCVAELPTLRRLAAQSGGRMNIVAISEDFAEPETVDAFWQAHGFAGWPLWLDQSDAASDHYGISTLPVTIYYGADGKEVWRFTGGRDWTSPASVRLLATR